MSNYHRDFGCNPCCEPCHKKCCRKKRRRVRRRRESSILPLVAVVVFLLAFRNNNGVAGDNRNVNVVNIGNDEDCEDFDCKCESKCGC